MNFINFLMRVKSSAIVWINPIATDEWKLDIVASIDPFCKDILKIQIEINSSIVFSETLTVF